jgi:hypothetical protein
MGLIAQYRLSVRDGDTDCATTSGMCLGVLIFAASEDAKGGDLRE